MRKNGLIVLLVLVLGCEAHTPKQSPSTAETESASRPSPEPAQTPLSGYILLRSGAPLYKRAGDNAPLIPGTSGKADLAGASVYRVITDKADWIEVENLPMWASENKRHCYGRSEKYLSNSQIHFWVHAKDLHRVTTTTTTHEFADGSRFELRPGAAVTHLPTTEEPDRHFTKVEGFEFYLKLSTAEVGYGYLPEPSEAKGEPLGRTYRFKKSLNSGSMGLADSVPRPYATGTNSPSMMVEGSLAGSVVAQVKGDCLDLKLKVEASALEKQETGYSYGVLGGEVDFLAKVAKGASIYWRGGELAGTAYREMRVEPSDKELEADGERRCFSVDVRKTWMKSQEEERGKWRVDVALELCFNVSDLSEPQSTD